jgi:hypothetical protein
LRHHHQRRAHEVPHIPGVKCSHRFEFRVRGTGNRGTSHRPGPLRHSSDRRAPGRGRTGSGERVRQNGGRSGTSNRLTKP